MSVAEVNSRKAIRESYDFIVITDHAYINGGLANVAINQAIGLVKNGYKVLFLSGTAQVSNELRASGADVMVIGEGEFLAGGSRIGNIAAGLFSLRVYRNVRDILGKCDLEHARVLVHGWSKCLSPSLFYALKKARARVYLWNHDYFLICPNGGLFNYKKRRACNLRPGSIECLSSNCDSRNFAFKLYRFVRHWILMFSGYRTFVEGFVTIGSRNTEIVRNYLPGVRTFLVENFIDVPPDCDRPDTSKSGSVVVIGRPSPEKGLVELLESLGTIGFRRRIIVVGAQESDYRNVRVSDLDVSFTGWVTKERVAAILAEAQYLIFPSLWYEGAPLVVQEAFSHGLPVVCANTNAGADLVLACQAGIIYDPYSTESLKRAVDQMEDPEILHEKSRRAIEGFRANSPTMERHILMLREAVGMN